MYNIQSDETEVIELEEVGYIEREMLVAGDISIDGSRILLRRAHSEGIEHLHYHFKFYLTKFII